MTSIRDQVIEKIRTVYDPEIPVNVYDIGLIYEIEEKAEGRIHIRMTLTSPNCPVAETLPLDVQAAAESVDGVAGAEVDVVWDPPWGPDMMSEAAQLELGFY
jgi:FeS assembly SUF system protein